MPHLCRRSISMRRESGASAPSPNPTSYCRLHEVRRMAVKEEHADARRAAGALDSRVGPDLWPRVAAAVVLGLAALFAAWAGGVVFVAFWWIASVIVLWEWQTLVQTDRRTERVAA